MRRCRLIFNIQILQNIIVRFICVNSTTSCSEKLFLPINAVALSLNRVPVINLQDTGVSIFRTRTNAVLYLKLVFSEAHWRYIFIEMLIKSNMCWMWQTSLYQSQVFSSVYFKYQVKWILFRSKVWIKENTYIFQ